MTTIYYFVFPFTKLNVSEAPSDTPTVNVLNIITDETLEAGNVTKSMNMPGLCVHAYTGADDLLLAGLAHSTDTSLDAQDVYFYNPASKVVA